MLRRSPAVLFNPPFITALLSVDERPPPRFGGPGRVFSSPNGLNKDLPAMNVLPNSGSTQLCVCVWGGGQLWFQFQMGAVKPRGGREVTHPHTPAHPVGPESLDNRGSGRSRLYCHKSRACHKLCCLHIHQYLQKRHFSSELEQRDTQDTLMVKWLSHVPY